MHSILKKTSVQIHIIGMLVMLLLGCTKEAQQEKNRMISQSIKSLGYFLGSEDANRVVIMVQGGPSLELEKEYFEKATASISKDKVLLINIHQGQTEKPDFFLDEEPSESQISEVTQKTIDNSITLTKYFKDQGRHVYIAGASYGASLVQELMHRKGTSFADKFLIMVGRLKYEAAFIEALKSKQWPYFENGILQIEDATETDIVGINIQKLAVDVLQHDFIQRFENFDLSNVAYVYSTSDESVGPLTHEELDFLNKKKVPITISKLDHDQTISEYIAKSFKDFFGI